MQSFSLLLLAAILVYRVEANAKVTPEILSCANQLQERSGDEANTNVKNSMQSLLESMRTGDFHSVQKVLRETNEADRKSAMNKYMVDSCGELKTCMICPLELA